MINAYSDFFLNTGLVTAVVIFVYIFIVRRKIIVPNKKGEIKLRPTVWPLFAGFSLLAILLFFGNLIFSNDFQTNLNKVLFVFLALPFLFLGIYNVMYYLRHRLIVNEKELIVINWKGEVVQVKWQEIKNMKRGFPLPRIIPYTVNISAKNRLIKIDPNLKGFKTFEVYLNKFNPDMGLLMGWHIYHNPEGGNNYL